MFFCESLKKHTMQYLFNYMQMAKMDRFYFGGTSQIHCSPKLAVKVYCARNGDLRINYNAYIKSKIFWARYLGHCDCNLPYCVRTSNGKMQSSSLWVSIAKTPLSSSPTRPSNCPLSHHWPVSTCINAPLAKTSGITGSFSERQVSWFSKYCNASSKTMLKVRDCMTVTLAWW